MRSPRRPRGAVKLSIWAFAAAAMLLASAPVGAVPEAGKVVDRLDCARLTAVFVPAESESDHATRVLPDWASAPAGIAAPATDCTGAGRAAPSPVITNRGRPTAGFDSPEPLRWSGNALLTAEQWAELGNFLGFLRGALGGDVVLEIIDAETRESDYLGLDDEEALASETPDAEPVEPDALERLREEMVNQALGGLGTRDGGGSGLPGGLPAAAGGGTGVNAMPSLFDFATPRAATAAPARGAEERKPFTVADLLYSVLRLVPDRRSLFIFFVSLAALASLLLVVRHYRH